MSIIRYRPSLSDTPVFPRLSTGPNRIARMMEDVFGTELPEGLGWHPPVDVVEKEKELVLTMELPGMSLEDLEIDIGDNLLTVKGEKRMEEEKKEANYRLVERSFGAFERSFTLPRIVDAAAIKANYDNGILRIHMPKTAQAVGRKLEIGRG
ncbi:MAG TPA: Hsp20/alpha crystallin family protein [Longimicrobiales bacterium]|nr:Hsp20/alpha crystallin family protein [Longimicrobiales bacterium]